jgi:hypothetical protein
MSPRKDSCRTRCAWPTQLALILPAVLLSSVAPASDGPLLPRTEDTIYFQNGVDIYEMQASTDFITEYPKFANPQQGGAIQISVRRLVFPESGEDMQFVLSDPATTADILILGSANRMEALSGLDLGDVVKVEEMLTISAVRTSTVLSTSYDVGLDDVQILIPQDVLDNGASSDEKVLVIVNGTSEDISAAQYVEFRNGEIPDDLSPGFLALDQKFNDLARFKKTVHAEGIMRIDLDALYADGSNCSPQCLGCAVAGAAFVASSFAIAGCGATGGMACPQAIAAHIISEGEVLSQCGQCYQCKNPTEGGSQPGNECPAPAEPCPSLPEFCCTPYCGECNACVPVCACGCSG